jgi:hypothetical protein
MDAALDARTAKRFLLWSAALLPSAAIVAALFVDGWPARRFLILYAAPLFLAAPLWLRVRIAENGFAPNRQALVDGAVLAFSFLRFVLGELLPFSGHMLFLSYSGLTIRRSSYRWIALVLVAETTVFKLWIWRDPRSWSLGLAMGILAAAYVRLQPSRAAI